MGWFLRVIEMNKPSDLDIIANKLADYAKLLYFVNNSIEKGENDASLATEVMTLYEDEIKNTIREGNAVDEKERKRLVREENKIPVNWSIRDCDYTRMRTLVIDYLTALDTIVRYGAKTLPRKNEDITVNNVRVVSNPTTKGDYNVNASLVEQGNLAQKAVALEQKQDGC
jgi:hypothetical protein